MRAELNICELYTSTGVLNQYRPINIVGANLTDPWFPSGAIGLGSNKSKEKESRGCDVSNARFE
jgi:hypothetical protein